MTCYHIDTFTSEIFKGNPAAVCITSEPLSKELMQKIAAENNLSETAFVVPNGEIYSLRWFTPLSEIDLCGHATLASAFALKRFFAPEQNEFKFKTLSGILNVAYKDETFWLDFPSFSLKEVAVSEQMARAVGARPKRAFLGRDLLLIMQNESEVVDARPDMEFLSGLDGLITHISAMGKKFDCVSRSFAPKLGVQRIWSVAWSIVIWYLFGQKILVKARSQHLRHQKEVARSFTTLETTARQFYTLLASYFYKFISC